MSCLRLGSIVSLAVILLRLGAQGDEPADTSGAHQRLQELRGQIQQLESQIASSQAKETDLVSELDKLDRSISLRQSVIKTLGKERDRLEIGIEKIGRQIGRRQQELSRLERDRVAMQQQVDALKDVVARRAVYVYKYWNVNRWTVLLGAQSLPDLFSRQYYFRKLHYWDTKHMAELSQGADSLKTIESRIQVEQRNLRQDRQQREASLKEKDRLLSQKRNEESTLVDKKSNRANVLASVRKDREALKQQLEETRQAAEEIQKSIAALEARRMPEIQPPPPGYFTSGQPFASLKGKLPWPVSGRIVTRFGQYRHPRLGTITDNTGIDIEASKGTPVRAVSDAQVGMVTWLRGFGNTIILDHRDGHYSVYAHLDEINVAQNEWLKAGDIIGTVGETGSLDGPRLHFEIWNKRDIQNPELWLARSPNP
jgi:septal ring factor EnvC (AmiA/AmiB activator)